MPVDKCTISQSGTRRCTSGVHGALGRSKMIRLPLLLSRSLGANGIALQFGSATRRCLSQGLRQFPSNIHFKSLTTRSHVQSKQDVRDPAARARCAGRASVGSPFCNTEFVVLRQLRRRIRLTGSWKRAAQQFTKLQPCASTFDRKCSRIVRVSAAILTVSATAALAYEYLACKSPHGTRVSQG